MKLIFTNKEELMIRTIIIFLLSIFVLNANDVNNNLTVPESVKDVIKLYEGWRAKPYKDLSGKHHAIGYGFSTKHTNKTMTREEGDRIFDKKILIIQEKIKSKIKVPLNQNQLSVLVDMVYNIGLSKILKSTMVKHLNNGDYDLAGKQINRWCKANGKTLRGLVKRRAWNTELWNTDFNDNQEFTYSYSNIEYFTKTNSVERR